MLPWNALLVDTAILVAAFTAFVLGTVLWRPRIWLHDFPEDIQALAPPKTPEEEWWTRILGVPFLLVFVGLPILLGLDLRTHLGASFGFWSLWLYGYALFLAVNVWDLVVLDWIGFALMDPNHPPIAGTEGAAGWRDYAFHARAFLRGCAFGVAFAAVFAGAVLLLG